MLYKYSVQLQTLHIRCVQLIIAQDRQSIRQSLCNRKITYLKLN